MNHRCAKVIYCVGILFLFFAFGVWADEVTLTKLGQSAGTGSYRGVFVKDTYAYCAAEAAGLDILDISNPANPVKLANYNTPGIAEGVYVQGSYAFIADNETVEIVDVSDPANPVYADSLDTGMFPLGITAAGDFAYIADAWNGLYVMDLKNLPQVSFAGTCDTDYYARRVCVEGNYAYVADDLGGLQIIDVSDPYSPVLADAVGKNIMADAVDVYGGYAYLGCFWSGLLVVDVSDPTDPGLAGSYPDAGGFLGVRGVEVRGQYAYLADSNGFEILNVSDPSSPTFTAGLSTPGYPSDIFLNGNYAYVADGYGGLQVVNVSTPTSPVISGSFDQSFSFDGICVNGNYAYLTDEWSGLHIFNISDLSNPVSVGNYSALTWAEGVQVRNGYAFVAAYEGLFIFNVSNPSNPVLAGKYESSGETKRVFLDGNYAYLADYQGLAVVDISSPTNPVLIASCPIPGSARDVYKSGNYVYVAAQSSGLQVVDVSDPANPSILGSCDTGNAFRIHVDGNYAYLTDPSFAQLDIIDISNPANPTPTRAYRVSGTPNSVCISGNYAFVSCRTILQVLNISDPFNPSPAGSYTFENNVSNMFISGSTLFITDFAGKFHILAIGSPQNSQLDVNRDALSFGADTIGNLSGAQTVSIDNTGQGTMIWSVSADQSWLLCSPSSGIDAAQLSISLAAGTVSGLSAGTYTGTITIDAPGAQNSPQTVAVTLTISTPAQTQAPFGTFATPVDGSLVSSSVPFTGWVLDDIGVESVKLYREPPAGTPLMYIGDAVFVEGARPDVEIAYPGYPFNYQAGWGYMMLTNFLPEGDGTYVIHAVAVDTEGKETTLGIKTIQVDNANAVKPFGAIDTPVQGGTASGGSYRNQGWVLTPLPNTIPTDGSTVGVYVDGVDQGNPVYNIYREDVAGLFPGYNNSDGALAYLDIDTTAFSNGVHTIAWSVTDDGGNSDGIGSRYFTIQNTPTQRSNSLSMPDSLVWDDGPVHIQRGYDPDAEPAACFPNFAAQGADKGIITVDIRELQRIVIRLGEQEHNTGHRRFSGYRIVGNQYRPLPIGSFLDPEQGIFYWQPGPGFVGKYRFLFVLDGEREKRVNIQIKPK